jgi:hypothetical protein
VCVCVSVRACVRVCGVISHHKCALWSSLEHLLSVAVLHVVFVPATDDSTRQQTSVDMSGGAPTSQVNGELLVSAIIVTTHNKNQQSMCLQMGNMSISSNLYLRKKKKKKRRRTIIICLLMRLMRHQVIREFPFDTCHMSHVAGQLHVIKI